MSILDNYATASARDAAYPAASNIGRCIFRTDSQAIEVSDGTNYLTYLNDGVLGTGTFTSNSYSVELDGTNDYIDTNNKFDFIQQTCNFSITCWVKIIDHTSTAANQFIVHSSIGSSNPGVMFWYDNRSSAKKLRFLLSGLGSSIDVSNGITDNNWHHYALTCANGGDQKLYKDGSLIGSQSAPSTTTNTAYHNLLLGAAYDTSTSLVTNPMNGYLDEVAIFNRELTSTEISNIINNKAYLNFFAMYRLENNANDENGVNDGTNFNATFVTSEKPY